MGGTGRRAFREAVLILLVAGVAAVLAGCTVEDLQRATSTTSGTSTDGSSATFDTSNCTVRADRATALANGTDLASVTVTVRSLDGSPVTGAAIILIASGSGNNLLQPVSLTDANGVARGTLSSTKAEQKTVSAAITLTNTSVVIAEKATVEFLGDPGTVSAANSSVGTSPATGALADGLDPVSVYVTVRDAYSNPVRGQTVRLSASGSSNTLIQPAALTDSTGLAVGRLYSTNAGVKTITATVNPGASQVVLATQPSAEFVEPPIDAAASSVYASPPSGLAADGVATATILVVVRSTGGGAIAGQVVTIAATGSGNALVQPLSATDANGIARGTLASTVAEAKEITVSVNGHVTLAARPTVTFVPAAATSAVVSAARSDVQVSPLTVTANGTAYATVTVTVTDASGSPISGQSVMIESSGTGDTISQPALATDANGIATGTIRSTVAETKTISIIVNPGSSETHLSATRQVAFTADAANVSATLSTLEVTPSVDVVANGTAKATITVVVRDANGNVIEGQSVAVSASAPGGSIVQPGLTGADGAATGTLATTGAGARTLTAVVNPGPDAVTLATSRAVTFIGDAATVSRTASTVTVAPASGVVADDLDTATITITVRDRYGNPVPWQTVSVAASGSDNQVVLLNSLTDANGEARALVSSTKAERKTITVTVNPWQLTQVVLWQEPRVDFVGDPAAVDPGASTVEASPETVSGDGVATSTIAVTVKDSNGNVVPGVAVTLSASPSSGVTFVQPTVTDANGVATGAIASTVPGQTKVSAAVNPGASQVVLDETATITFEPAGGLVSGSVNVPTPVSGVAVIGYTIWHASSLSGAVSLEFDRDGSGNFELSTQVYNVATSPTGRAQTIAWKSALDMPNTNTTTASVRLTASFFGATSGGLPVTVTGITVLNGLRLASAVAAQAGSAPGAVALGDLDLDGDLDLAVVDSSDQSVKVLRGDGTGTGCPSVESVDVGASQSGISIGDLNRDGKPDIAASLPAAASIAVLLNAQTGRSGYTLERPEAPVAPPPAPSQGPFSVGIDILAPASGSPGASAVVVADMNGDGYGDIVVGNMQEASVTLVRGLGDGTFDTAVDLSNPGYIVSVAIGNFDRFGQRDILVGTSGSMYYDYGYYGYFYPKSMSIHSQGAYSSFTRQDHVDTDQATMVVAGDLDGDGVDEIGAGSAGLLTGYRFTGSSFESLDSPLPLTSPVRSFATGDLNGDGNLDVAVALDSSILLLYGDGTGGFWGTGSLAVEAARCVVVVDLDGDGRDDLVIATGMVWDAGQSQWVRTVSVLTQDALGNLVLQPTIASTPTGYNAPRAIAIADFDADGRKDIATTNQEDYKVWVLLQKTTGNFVHDESFDTPTSAYTLRALATGDFNADGRPDLVVGREYAYPQVFLFTPAEQGSTLVSTTNSFSGSGSPRSPVVADMDRDGRLDVVVADGGSEVIVATQSPSDPARFTLGASLVPSGGGSAPRSAAAGDLNGDGALDLAVTNLNTGSVSVFFQMPGAPGTFAQDVTYSVGSSPRHVAIADVNRDGLLDLVIAVYGDSKVSILRQDPSNPGTFVTPAVDIWTAYGMTGVAVGDVNRDGVVDIAANSEQGWLYVILGNPSAADPYSNGTPGDGYASRTDFSMTSAQACAIGDLNHDGFPDIAAAHSSGVTVLLGNGTFTDTTEGSGLLKTTTITLSSATHVAIGDLNRDGALDCVVTLQGSSQLALLFGNKSWVDATAGSGLARMVFTYTRTGPQSVAIADIDSDGFTDLVVANEWANDVSVLRGR